MKTLNADAILARATAVSQAVDTGAVRDGARVSLNAAYRDNDGRRLDAVAGCEFLDDRIRLRDDLSPL